MTVQYYLPIDCPVCGRQRLEFTPSPSKIKCEKCGIEDIDFPSRYQIVIETLRKYQSNLENMSFDSLGRKTMWHVIERICEDL